MRQRDAGGSAVGRSGLGNLGRTHDVGDTHRRALGRARHRSG